MVHKYVSMSERLPSFTSKSLRRSGAGRLAGLLQALTGARLRERVVELAEGSPYGVRTTSRCATASVDRRVRPVPPMIASMKLALTD